MHIGFFVLLLFILIGFWWYRHNTIIEGYSRGQLGKDLFGDDWAKPLEKTLVSGLDAYITGFKSVTGATDETTFYNANASVYELSKNDTNKMNAKGDKISGGITTASDKVNSYMDAISSFIDTSEPVKAVPKNNDMYDTGDMSTAVANPVVKRDTSFIITDTCSSKSIINSDYSNDICKTYAGNYEEIDKKCQGLSPTNCAFSNCCVLLDDVKCVAGSISGPNFLTTDYEYYKYKSKCYGNCNSSSTYTKNCGMYAGNSRNVSKSCIVQMFNDAGCPNKTPNDLINDDYVHKYSQSSKVYIKNELSKTVKSLKTKIVEGDDDSRILCNGANPNNPCDVFNAASTNISSACMKHIYNTTKCQGKITGIIMNTDYAAKNSSLTKANMRDLFC